jgi:hypothetical protein
MSEEIRCPWRVERPASRPWDGLFKGESPSEPQIQGAPRQADYTYRVTSFERGSLAKPHARGGCLSYRRVEMPKLCAPEARKAAVLTD